MFIGIGISVQNKAASPPAVEEPAQFIVNGGFTTDTDWAKGAGWTIAAGIAENSGGIGALTETMEASITSGNDYVLQVEVLGNDLFETIQVSIGAQVVYQGAPSPGAVNVPFTATVSSAAIAIRGLDENGAWAIDNVSLVPA